MPAMKGKPQNPETAAAGGVPSLPEPRRSRRRLATAVLGGILYGLGFNWVFLPGVLGALAPVSALVGLGLVFRTLRADLSVRRGALLGGLAYLASGAVGLFWMNCITVPAYVGIVTYLALYGAAFGALAALIRRGVGPAAFPYMAATLWTALEFLRTWAFTGFPWMLAGSAWAGLPVAMGAADLGGVFLVSFLTVLVPALAVAERPARLWLRVAIAVGVALAALAYGWIRLGPSRTPNPEPRTPLLRIAAVQPLVPFKVGPKADPLAMLAEQQKLTRRVAPGSIDLLIWSETMVPGDLIEQVEPVLAPIAREKRCHFLAGGVIHEPEGDADGRPKAWNSAVLISPEGRVVGRYDKRHLVPFGEFVPFGGRFPGADQVFKLIGTVFTPGAEGPLPRVGDWPLAVDICYEDCFPEIARSDARRGARVLVNLTNDSWFRESSEARQHLALAAFRAVETRLPLLRATNTGISALLDADGRLAAPPEGALWQRGLVRLEVPLDPPRRTLYTRVGDAFAWLSALAALGGAAASMWRGRKPAPSA